MDDISSVKKSDAFYLETLSHITSLPILMINTKGDILLNLGGWRDEDHAVCQDKVLNDEIIAKVNEKNIFIYYDIFYIHFGVVKWFDDKIIIIGPFTDFDLSPGAVRAFSIKHNTNLKPISKYDFVKLAAVLIQINFLVTGEELMVNDVIGTLEVKDRLNHEINNQIENVLKRHIEISAPHNDGSWEVIRRKCIMQADVKGLNRHINAPFSGKRGVIANNPIRNLKNLAIVDVTVSSRAALDAGLDSETVYTISDGYILQIEECKTQSDIESIANLAANEFCQLVKKIKDSGVKFSINTPEVLVNAYNYILRNLNQKLNVTEIAQKVGISHDYLEKLFKRELGSTVGNFILSSRVKNSQNLLKNSNMSISEIAMVMGFSSSSHYIKAYKSIFNITPSKHRIRFKNRYLPDEIK